ncbi:MAG: hypothetical protein ACXVRU_09955 [Gaiellaceae bacterium]
MTTSPESRLDRLHRMIDLVEQIRRASGARDHDLVARLNERLAEVLAGSPEELLRTHELADWRFTGDNAAECDRLAASARDELQAIVLAHGLSPSSH